MAKAPNYWPHLDAVRAGPTPEDLLRQQADVLTQQTGGLLIGKVEIGSHGEWITLDLFVVAPRLNDYAYRLFKVRYKPSNPFEPVEIINDSKDLRRAKSQADYEQNVADLLGSTSTGKIIGELLALSRKAEFIPA